MFTSEEALSIVRRYAAQLKTMGPKSGITADVLRARFDEMGYEGKDRDDLVNRALADL